MWILKQTDARFFDRKQHAQLEALFDAILPGGEYSPGATDAQAAEYVDRLLALDDSIYYEIPAWQELYRAALPAVADAAATLHGAALAELSAEQRTDVVARLQRGELTGVPAKIDQRRFFSTLRAHCIEGCFADPRWGGNANRVMWRWYGYLQPAQPFRRTGAAQRAVDKAAANPTRGASLTRSGG
jgi:gluconate 2-dehydrogenase gamma chain